MGCFVIVSIFTAKLEGNTLHPLYCLPSTQRRRSEGERERDILTVRINFKVWQRANQQSSGKTN